MHRAMVVLALVAACERKSEDAPPERFPDLAPAQPTLACAIEARGHAAIYIAAEMADFAPLPLVRMAARLAVERARLDGPASLDKALDYEIGVLWKLDDAEGLRELFALNDADPKRWIHSTYAHAAERVSAGHLPVAHAVEGDDRIKIARELALAGFRDRALQLLEGVNDTAPRNPEVTNDYIGALAATGQNDRVRLIIERGYSFRVQHAGVWVETALRAGGSLAEPLATLLKEIRTNTDEDVARLDIEAIIHRARRTHREREIAPMIEALRPRLAAILSLPYGDHDSVTLALATDIATVVPPGAPGGDLAQRIDIARAPLAQAFATAQGLKDPIAILQVWSRWLVTGSDPTLGLKLHLALCPAANRTPATPATGVLSAEQVELPNQSECEPHDVVLKLSVNDVVRASRTLDGDCWGACTPAAKRAGAAEKARIEGEIHDGTSDPALANYSFTGCSFVGFELDEIQTADDRQIVLLRQHYQEAHDVDVTVPRIAFEACGEIYISDQIHVVNDEPWQTPRLRVALEHDVVVVRALSEEGANVVLRLALPTCPGVPTVVK